MSERAAEASPDDQVSSDPPSPFPQHPLASRAQGTQVRRQWLEVQEQDADWPRTVLVAGWSGLDLTAASAASP